MASLDTRSDPVGLIADIERRPLSALERRCLVMRIGDCHTLLRSAIAGIRWAQQQHQVGDLSGICAALQAAEAEVALAENQAAQIRENGSPGGGR